MNLPDTSGEYITSGAPTYIRELFKHGTRDLKRWKKTATLEQLDDAYDFIRRDMPHLLEEVEKEINLRRHKETTGHLIELKKPRPIDRKILVVAAATLVVTIGCFIEGCLQVQAARQSAADAATPKQPPPLAAPK